MSEKKKPPCFGKMDTLGTSTKCSLCEYDEECWNLSFGDKNDMET